MTTRILVAASVCILLSCPALASTWLRPSFWSSVQTADVIVVGRVDRVAALARPERRRGGR